MALLPDNPGRLIYWEPLVGENWAHIQARGHFPSRGTFEINGRKLSVRSEPLEGTDETVVLATDITYQQTLQHELGRKSVCPLGDGRASGAS